MDWLRSCYVSEWLLFQDSNVPSVGRYYKSPPGTPFLEGFHNYGSKVWYDRNWQLVQSLGEKLTTKTKWDPGTPPALPPRNLLTGDSLCLVNGELIANAIDPAELIDGFPPTCFIFPQENLIDWSKASSFRVCSLQRFYAAVIQWLYEDDEVSIREAFLLLLGPAYTVVIRRQVGNFPAMVTVTGNGIFILVLDGTRTFQQFALQALYSLGSPENFGPLSTNRFWYLTVQYVNTNCQADGLVAGMRFFVAGHSYGAAVALVYVGLLKHWNAMTAVNYLTFGCPKIGDLRLQALAGDFDGLNLANDTDLVTVLPPDFETLLPVMTTLGAPQLLVWVDWFRPLNQQQLNPDGTIDPNTFPPTDYATLLAIAVDVLANIQLLPIVGHTMAEYARHLNVRCPGPIWPVNKDLDDLIKESDEMLQEDLEAMLQEDLEAMLLEP